MKASIMKLLIYQLVPSVNITILQYRYSNISIIMCVERYFDIICFVFEINLNRIE